jgi:hypothetical protein
VTSVGQKLSALLQQLKEDAVTAINARVMSSHFFINMDQSAVYFEFISECILVQKCAQSVCARDSGSHAIQCTIFVTVAVNGTKLPPYFYFK